MAPVLRNVTHDTDHHLGNLELDRRTTEEVTLEATNIWF
jgi:hypothetical protein